MGIDGVSWRLIVHNTNNKYRFEVMSLKMATGAEAHFNIA